MESEAPKTPAQRIEEVIKAWMKDFGKTPYVYPFAIALAAGVYYLVLVYAVGICLIGLVTPLVMLGVLWLFGIKNVKRLAIVGLVAVVLLSMVWLGVFTDHYSHVQPTIATSEDGRTLTNGTVSPFRGQSGQIYRFSLEVHHNVGTVPKTFSSVTVLIASFDFPGGVFKNHTMTLDTARSDVNTSYYYADTPVESSINIYYFAADYTNGSTEIGGGWTTLGAFTYPVGPVSMDSGAIALTLVPYAFVNTFLGVYVAYILIVGMVWWTRRARKMREQQIEKWKLEEAEREAAKPKSTQLKVPTRSKEGTEKGETFVCSECGGDVPAEATVCPHCGEKFD